VKLGLALLTKDKPDLTRRSIEPLLQPDKFSLWIMDGSSEKANEDFALSYPQTVKVCAGVRGGPDAAIVHSLTWLLDEGGYDYIGLCEQDVLLHPDWFGPTLALFDRGQADGLEVGAVSARCYEDRVLIQRDGYAVAHNLGAGHVIFTREAARIILDNYRTAWWLDNRLIFCQLSGLDIGTWAAFRGNEQWVTADWGFDAILARHGLASLALTPSLATMLDQDIAAQGLRMADGNFDLLRNEKAFEKFVGYTHQIRNGTRYPGVHGRLQCANGVYTIFPHQIPGIGGTYSGDWRLKWAQGFGPFVWESGNQEMFDRSPRGGGSRPTGGLFPTLEVSILGPCEFLLGGTGRARVTDTHSGYSIESSPVDAGGGILQVPVPSGVSYRTIRLEALTPGVCCHGIRTREPQPWLTGYRFDHSQLPRTK
jgi:hypothetical protein